MSESIKVALVTGASRGIGKAIALELGSMGFCVVGTATTQAGAEAIASYFKEQGIAGGGVAADVSNDESGCCTVRAFERGLWQPCGNRE
jgi:3-oxoacyl-[acyl-carrier protein] reductase